MEKSIVSVSMRDENDLDCSYAIVQKDELKIIIVLRNSECGIFDLNNLKSFNYLLLKHYPDDESAYRDFLKLMGKMCKKSKDSKYFLNHIDEDNRIVYIDSQNEHMINDVEKDEYKERLTAFEDFINENIKKF
jgi:hypothetical protein